MCPNPVWPLPLSEEAIWTRDRHAHRESACKDGGEIGVVPQKPKNTKDH